MELKNGRPKDLTGRDAAEIRVYDLLDRLQIPYEYVDHAAAMTMDDCAEVDAILDAVICKNLFLCNRQHTKYYLLMMPGDKKFHTAQISSQIGSARLSFGSPEKMEEFLDLTPGSVSVMGLMNDKENQVQLLMDEDIKKGEYFGCHPCRNTTSIRLSVSDLLGKVLPEMHHKPVYLTLTDE